MPKAHSPPRATTATRPAVTLAGTDTVDAGTFTDVTTGGSGEVLDTASGIILTNGDQSVTLDTSNLETVEQLLNAIEGSGLGLLAEINAAGDGINVRSRLSGADLTIGENGGTTATQLGIRTYTGADGAGRPQPRCRRNDDRPTWKRSTRVNWIPCAFLPAMESSWT